MDKDNQTYLLNDREAQTVHRIFELYDAGFSYDAIIRDLNATGCKTKLGNVFSKNSITDILRNEKYLGIYTYNRRPHKVKGMRNNRKEKPVDQIVKIPGGMPQIIEQELWDRVQAKISARHRTPGREPITKQSRNTC